MSSYDATREFALEEVHAFLRAMDTHLSRPAQIIIVGGSAAVFYDAESTTNDIDTYSVVDAALQQAAQGAAAETGLSIPVRRSTVGDYPDGFEERLERRLAELTNLEVWILEKYDLVLSKTVRGTVHDDQQITEMHRANPFDFETLVERYRTGVMNYVVGNERSIRINFLQVVDLLFGELKSIAAKKALEASQP